MKSRQKRKLEKYQMLVPQSLRITATEELSRVASIESDPNYDKNKILPDIFTIHSLLDKASLAHQVNDDDNDLVIM